MNKRILVAADIHTHPINGGNQQCIMQYVECLRKLGCDVFFLYIDLYEGRFINKETRDYWGDHFFYYRTPRLQIFLQKILRRVERSYYLSYVDVYYPHGMIGFVNRLNDEYHFDGLIVNYIWNSKLADCNIPIKAIYTHDVFTNRNDKLGKKDAWYSFPQDEERKGISRFSEVLSIQDEETDWYKMLAPNSNIRTIYSSFSFVKQPVCANKNILFFSGAGKLNKEGLDRFIAEAWPLIVTKDKDIKLLLGGNICSCYNQAELPERVVLKGRYDCPDDFYAEGDICINPVFNGSGLKIKTFEALAHGKVTIVDPHSALGVYKPDSIPLFKAKSPNDYADVIFRYIGNRELLEAHKSDCLTYINQLNGYILKQYSEVFAL